MKKFILFTLIFISCSKKEVEFKDYSSLNKNTEYPLEFTDNFNSKVYIKNKPQKVLSLTLFTDEVMFGLYDSQDIYAVSYLATNDNFSYVYDKISTNTLIVNSNIEDILRVSPDLIFIAPFLNEDTKNALKLSGIKFYDIKTPHNINQVTNMIANIGIILDKQKEANSLIENMNLRLDKVLEKSSKNTNKLRVLFLSMNGYTYGSDISFDEMASYANVINVASELGIKGEHKIADEVLLKADIDYIIASEYKVSDDEIINFFLKHPVYKNIEAIKNGNIVIFNHKDIMSTSQYLVDTIEIFNNKMQSLK